MPRRSLHDQVRRFATASLLVGTIFTMSAQRGLAAVPFHASKPQILSNVLYVSDSRNKVIMAYEDSIGMNFPVLGQIAVPTSPEGITTDANSNLYVALRESVHIYPPATFVGNYGKKTITFPKKPSVILTDPNLPRDVAIGPDAEIYVADRGNPNTEAGGDVSVFFPGSTTAAYTIPFGTGTFVDGVTLDPANNLYISWHDIGGTAYVNTSPPPSSPGGTRTMGSSIAAITGDLFRGLLYDDRYAAVVYADYAAPQIWTYPEIKRDGPFDRLGSPDYIGFDKDKVHLYVPDYVHDLVEVYSFPGGSLRRIFSGLPGGAPAGCALVPAPAL